MTSQFSLLRGGIVTSFMMVLVLGAAPGGNLTWAKEMDPWQTSIEQGMIALNEGRYADANEWLHAAGHEAERFDDADVRVAVTMNNLGLLHHEQGRYALAKPLFERALAIWKKTRGRETLDVAAALNNLAEVYLEQGQFAQAEPLY